MMRNDYKDRLMQKRTINKEKIKEQISIIDLAAEYFTIEKHGTLFRLKEHDSCVLYPATNTWHRYAYNKSGDVLSFLEEFSECGNLTFNEAYKKLLPLIDESIEVDEKIEKKREQHKNDIQFKQKCAVSLKSQLTIDNEHKHVLAYLIKERKIDPSIVYDLLDKHYIYQVKNDFGGKNVAFCGYNEYGMLASVCVRGCNSSSSFKGDFKNCDYNYCWLYTPKISPDSFCPDIDGTKTLICFESYIDMMSYMTLLKMNNQNIDDYNYVSCGSIEKKDTVLRYQERYNIKNVIIAFDNDPAGQLAAKNLSEKLEVKGCMVKLHVSEQKDWNDQLKAIKETKNLSNRIKNAKANLTNEKNLPIDGKKIDRER